MTTKLSTAQDESNLDPTIPVDVDNNPIKFSGNPAHILGVLAEVKEWATRTGSRWCRWPGAAQRAARAGPGGRAGPPTGSAARRLVGGRAGWRAAWRGAARGQDEWARRTSQLRPRRRPNCVRRTSASRRAVAERRPRPVEERFRLS